MQLGCGLPMGPLALMDLIGLDTAYEILDTMYKQGRDRLHAPSPILKQMVTAGLRGRKSGQGFYKYAEAGSSQVVHTQETLVPPGGGCCRPPGGRRAAGEPVPRAPRRRAVRQVGTVMLITAVRYPPRTPARGRRQWRIKPACSRPGSRPV